ncbi:MAG TPA: Na+/H+ antiporter NhaC family protein [Desulfosporosinus sp.]|nr:Na+/H+ antiporter NhaC family protein [Desulfosporosinus sp.]
MTRELTYLHAFSATVPTILALIVASQMGLQLQMPFIFGILLTCLIGVRLGYSWNELEAAALKGMGQCSFALLILFLVGATIGIWIASGIIPTFMFYGLHWLSPKLFLAESCFLTFLMALVTGSNAAAFGTIGVALLSVGIALGIPMPLVAGAITSGGTAGHLISPLSDLSALAISTNGGNLSTLVKLFVRRSIPVLFTCEVIYILYGVFLFDSASLPNVDYLFIGLKELFVISPWLLLPVASLFLLIIFRVPIVLALGINLLLSSSIAIFVQGLSFSAVIKVMNLGYTTHSTPLAQILTRGGVIAFGNVVELVLLASAWAATMQYIGVMQLLLKKMMQIKILKGKVTATGTLLSIIITVMTCAVIPAILVPSAFLKEKYIAAGLQSEHLSRDLTEASLAAAALVPWSNLNFIVLATLGIGAFQTTPYNLFSWLILILAFTIGIRNKHKIQKNGGQR